MRMGQYLTHTDYALLEVNVNGDAPAAVASASTGAEAPIEVSWSQGCKNLIGSNQDQVWRQQRIKENAEDHSETEDANLKLLRSLPSAWNTHNTSSTNEAVNTAHDVLCMFKDKLLPQPMLMMSCFPSLLINLIVHREVTFLENAGHQGIRGIEMETPANALVITDGMGYDWSYQAEEGPTNFDLGPSSQSRNESEVVHSVFNSAESNVDDSRVNDRFKTGKGFHAVPPPYTRNYMPPRPDLSFVGLDESVFQSAMRKTTTCLPETETSISKTSKDILEKLKTVRPSAPIIKEWDIDNDNDSVFRPKSNQIKPKFTKINFVKSGENVNSVNKENTHRQAEYPRKSQSPRKKPVLNNKGRVTGQREIRPVWNNAQRVNHQNKLTHPHPKRNFVPTAVATKSGQVPVNAAKQSSPRAATSISTARPVNTVAPKPKVNDALPTTYSYFKAHSPVRRAFNQKSAAKTNNFNEKVNTVRFNNVTTVGPKAVVSTVEGNKDNVVKSSACWI
ncbi:hypothetical protein Tco_0348916 [Tanacetum coccineum]